MAFWSLIPAIAGMGMQASGAAQNAAATVDGAKAQSKIEAMNRAYQKELFDEEMGRLKPYYEMGTEQGLPLMQQFQEQGQIDQNQMPLFRMQQQAGLSGLAQQGIDDPFSRQYFNDSLNASEQDASYARLNDALQISLGQSGAAGAGAANYATNYANSQMTGGNAMALGQGRAGAQRQGMYSNLAGQASSIPAYMSQSNYLKTQRG